MQFLLSDAAARAHRVQFSALSLLHLASHSIFFMSDDYSFSLSPPQKWGIKKSNQSDRTQNFFVSSSGGRDHLRGGKERPKLGVGRDALVGGRVVDVGHRVGLGRVLTHAWSRLSLFFCAHPPEIPLLFHSPQWSKHQNWTFSKPNLYKTLLWPLLTPPPKVYTPDLRKKKYPKLRACIFSLCVKSKKASKWLRCSTISEICSLAEEERVSPLLCLPDQWERVGIEQGWVGNKIE